MGIRRQAGLHLDKAELPEAFCLVFSLPATKSLPRFVGCAVADSAACEPSANVKPITRPRKAGF